MINAVIGYAPSVFTNGALHAGRPGEDRHTPCWTYQGQDLPVLCGDNPKSDWSILDHGPSPRRQTPAYLAALDHSESVERAMIPVERIKGPILLISGEDDDLWPSVRFAEIAMHRLRHARHPFLVNHLRYAHAGHTIAVPYVPVPRLAAPHPVSGIEIAFGGAPEGCAKANEEFWPEVLAFLKSATALCE